jgi:hypothetical protein
MPNGLAVNPTLANQRSRSTAPTMTLWAHKALSARPRGTDKPRDARFTSPIRPPGTSGKGFKGAQPGCLQHRLARRLLRRTRRRRHGPAVRHLLRRAATGCRHAARRPQVLRRAQELPAAHRRRSRRPAGGAGGLTARQRHRQGGRLGKPDTGPDDAVAQHRHRRARSSPWPANSPKPTSTTPTRSHAIDSCRCSGDSAVEPECA